MTQGTKFIVADQFKVDISDNALVKISFLDDNFKSWFLGKIEEMEDVEIPRPHHDLYMPSLDSEIIDYLGGEDKAETTMAGIYELMKLQRNGEDGSLLNRFGNQFYVRDTNSVLRAVRILWYGDGWWMCADRVDYVDRWFAGLRVFFGRFLIPLIFDPTSLVP